MIVVHRGQLRKFFQVNTLGPFIERNDFICNNINADLIHSYLLCGVGGLLRDHISNKDL